LNFIDNFIIYKREDDMIESSGVEMIDVNGKLLTKEEFEALKKDPNKRLTETEEPNKFRLLEKMLG
jgi:hypothetical protein